MFIKILNISEDTGKEEPVIVNTNSITTIRIFDTYKGKPSFLLSFADSSNNCEISSAELARLCDALQIPEEERL